MSRSGAGCREAATSQHHGGRQPVGGAAGGLGFRRSAGAGAGRARRGGSCAASSRRFYERVAVATIVLGALRGIGQDNRVSAMESLRAWNKRQVQRLERKAQREGRAVKGSARMARSGRPRGLAG